MGDVFTLTEAGVYEISVQAQFDSEPANWSGGGGNFYVWMLMQLEGNIGGSGFQPLASSRTIFDKEIVTTSFTPITTLVQADAGDQLRIRVLRGGGSNRTGGGNAEAKFKNLIIKKVK